MITHRGGIASSHEMTHAGLNSPAGAPASFGYGDRIVRTADEDQEQRLHREQARRRLGTEEEVVEAPTDGRRRACRCRGVPLTHGFARAVVAVLRARPAEVALDAVLHPFAGR